MGGRPGAGRAGGGNGSPTVKGARAGEGQCHSQVRSSDGDSEEATRA
jgi:hypothetical protein